MSEMDYTFAERQNRDGNKYGTPIDDTIVDGTVDALTSDAAYLEALSDKFALDEEFLAAMAANIATELTANYALDIMGEQPVPGEAFDSDPGTTPTHTFDPVAELGDDGVFPGSVTMTFTMSDDSTETFTDAADDGILVGDADGAGVIDYDTGIAIITWGTLSAKTGTEGAGTYAYSYLINVFEPEVVLSPATLESLADYLASDAEFLAGLKDALLPVVDVVATVAGETTEMIAITFEQQDTAGDPLLKAQAYRLFFFTALDGTQGLGASLTDAITTGMYLDELDADKEYLVMSDASTGTIVVEITDGAAGSLTQYVALVNETTGQVVVATITFTA